MNRSTQGQTFSGILVASGCNSSSMNGAWSGKGKSRSADTTPDMQPIDQSGSLPRGTQPGDIKRTTAGDRAVNTPQTGMADRERGGDTSATSGSRKGSQWESGAANTGGWDHACFISPTTTSFAFVTKDGKQMNLDEASNTLVSQRLSSGSRVSEKSKVFRVRITGDKSGDSVHITEIQM